MEFFNIKEQDWVSVPFSITEFHMDFTYVAHARGLVYIVRLYYKYIGDYKKNKTVL